MVVSIVLASGGVVGGCEGVWGLLLVEEEIVEGDQSEMWRRVATTARRAI